MVEKNAKDDGKTVLQLKDGHYRLVFINKPLLNSLSRKLFTVFWTGRPVSPAARGMGQELEQREMLA